MAEPTQRHEPSSPLPRLLALAAVVAASGWVVWAVNSPLGWLAKVLQVLVACLVAVMVAGSVGVETINIFSTMAVLTMATEGGILGGRLYGWLGAVAGVVIGLLLSPFVALAATVLVVALAWLGSSGGTPGDQASVEETGEPPGPEPGGPGPGALD